MLQTGISLIVCALCCITGSPELPPGEWTRFRGPNGTGVVEGVQFPVAWTEKDFAWQADLPGKGHSSPVVWRNQLYVTAADAESGDVILIALDTKTGNENWVLPFDLQPHQVHTTNTMASCSAAVDSRHVYLPVVSPEAILLVAVTHDGREVWRRDFGTYVGEHGSGISPIVLGNQVILACDHEGESFVAALDCRTGKNVWQLERKPCKASYATPAVWESPTAQQLILHSNSEGMVGMSPSGKILWQLADVFPERCVNSPLVADGLVFGGSGGGANGISLVCVRPGSDSTSNAELVYELRKSVPQVPTPVARGDMLFILHDRGTMSCRDLHSGEEFWTERIGGQYYSSPICGGAALLRRRQRRSHVLAAEKEFAELGRSQLPGSSHATPAVVGNRMFLRSESAVVCLLAE